MVISINNNVTNYLKSLNREKATISANINQCHGVGQTQAFYGITDYT